MVQILELTALSRLSTPIGGLMCKYDPVLLVGVKRHVLTRSIILFVTRLDPFILLLSLRNTITRHFTRLLGIYRTSQAL